LIGKSPLSIPAKALPVRKYKKGYDGFLFAGKANQQVKIA